MRTKTNVKAGGMNMQHNETLRGGLRLKTHVKAGGVNMQHNETLRGGLKLKTCVKAGGIQMQHNETLTRGGFMKRVIPTSNTKAVKRLRLCVVRTGLRAGKRELRARH